MIFHIGICKEVPWLPAAWDMFVFSNIYLYFEIYGKKTINIRY